MWKTMTRAKLYLGVAFLVCAITGWVFTTPIEVTEFSGGRITGRLLDVHNMSGYLFVAALVVTLLSVRLAAVIGVVACVLSFPLYAYFVFPRPFQQLTGGEYSVPATISFAWSSPAIICLAVAIVTLVVCIKGLSQ